MWRGAGPYQGHSDVTIVGMGDQLIKTKVYPSSLKQSQLGIVNFSLSNRGRSRLHDCDVGTGEASGHCLNSRMNWRLQRKSHVTKKNLLMLFLPKMDVHYLSLALQPTIVGRSPTSQPRVHSWHSDQWWTTELGLELLVAGSITGAHRAAWYPVLPIGAVVAVAT